MDPGLTDRDVAGLLIGVLGPIAVAGVLVGARGLVGAGQVAVLLTVVVVIAAGVGGRAAGAAAALSATVSFDFFHGRPDLVLAPGRDDVEMALILLAVALFVDHLAKAPRRRADAAVARQRSSLHRVVELAASGDAELVAAAVIAEVTAALGLAECRIDGDRPERVPVLARTGQLEGPLFFADGEFALPAQGVAVAIVGGGRNLGYLVGHQARPRGGVSIARRRAAILLADQLGLALVVRGPTVDGP